MLNVTTHLENQFMYNILALKEKGWTNMQSTAREVLTGTGMCLFMWSRGREIAVANSQAYQKPQAPLNSIFILFSRAPSLSLPGRASDWRPEGFNGHQRAGELRSALSWQQADWALCRSTWVQWSCAACLCVWATNDSVTGWAAGHSDQWFFF